MMHTHSVVLNHFPKHVADAHLGQHRVPVTKKEHRSSHGVGRQQTLPSVYKLMLDMMTQRELVT